MFIELTEMLRCPRDHAESYVVAAPIVMDGRRIVRGVVGCPECKAEFPIVDGVVYFVEEASGEPRGPAGRGPAVRGKDAGGPAGFAPNLPAPEGGARGGSARLGGLRPSASAAPPSSPGGPAAHLPVSGREVDAPPSPDAPAARPPLPDYDAAALAAFLNLSGPGGYVALAGRAARLAPEIVALLPGVHVVAVNPPAGVVPLPMLSVLESPRRLPFKSGTLRAVALGADHAGAPWLADAVRVLLPGLRLVVEDERAGPEGVSELARGAGLFVGSKDR